MSKYFQNEGSLHSHPVYSDYSHLASSRQADIGNIAFVASLREENGRNLLPKILPMTKIVPIKQKSPVPIIPLPDPEHPKEGTICMRDECISRRNMYAEIIEASKHMKIELESMKNKVKDSYKEVIIKENEVIESEQRNERLTKEIAAIESRIGAVKSQVNDVNNQNETLRIQLGSLRQDMEKLTVKTKEAENRLSTAVASKCGPSVVFSKMEFQGSVGEVNEELANEVSQLGYNDEDSEPDD